MFKSVFKSGIRGIYNVSDNASFQTDMWSVYPAKHKQTGKVVSVFIFDKTKFESAVHRLCSQSPNTKNPKMIISECYEIVKFEVSQLTKLKHPQILTIIEVLEETKLKFLFASEQVVSNLATLDTLKEDELSIQKGLLEVSKGLQFLHNYCSIIHLNIQPLSVYVNAQGDWKLAGFKFLQNLNELSPLERENFYIMNNSSIVPFANLNLNYTAPELIVDSSSQRLSTANDMWSLGLLVFFLYNKGDTLINCFDQNSPSDFKSEFRKFEQKFYNHHPSELRYLLKEVPESLSVILTQLLARYPNDRLNVDQFIDSDYFNGSLIKMMWFIDEFSTKTMEDKLVFLEGLLGQGDNLLSQFPSTFRNSKLLPLLVDVITSELALLSNKKLNSDTNKLLSDSLLVVLKIGEDLSSLSFQDRIYGPLLSNVKPRKADASPLTKLAKSSVKMRLALVDNMPVLLKKLQAKQFTDTVKELGDLCLTFAPTEVDLQQDQIQLQDTFLANLSLVAEMFDFPYMKNTLLPMLCLVFKTTTVLSTKLQTLSTFQMLIDKKVIDKVIVVEQLLPVIENLKSRDKRIVSHVLQFFVQLSQSDHISLDLEVAVDKVLVQCFRLAFGCSDCNKNEFSDMMKSITAIQSSLTDRKLATLSEGSTAHVTSFDSIINTPLLRHANVDEIKKAPQLKPMALGNNQQKPPPPQKDVTRRTIVPQKTEQLRSQNAPLSFGATSSRSNAINHTVTSGVGSFGQQNNDDEEFQDFQDGSLAPAGNIDWSAAKTPTRINAPLYGQHTNSLLFGQTGSSQVGHKTATALFGLPLQPQTMGGNQPKPTSLVKYPPGFNANIVLTPNPTDSAQPKSSNLDLLDFL